MTDFICKKCGSTEYEIKDKPNGTGIAHGLYCAKCGFWHKWLGKKELKQYDATKESKDEIIAKLQSENAELRSRLDKAVELPFKNLDKVFILAGEDTEAKQFIPDRIVEGTIVGFGYDIYEWADGNYKFNYDVLVGETIIFSNLNNLTKHCLRPAKPPKHVSRS